MNTNTTVLSVNNIQVLVDQAKLILQNSSNVAIPQAWNVLQLAVADIIQNIEANNPSLKGADKKTLAMAMISNFYDKVFTVINFPFVPTFLQPIIQKSVKQLLMILVSASIDALVTTFRKNGVFVDSSTPSVNPENDKTPAVSDK